ncbi:hypothetical protein, partial [Escherichia coli]|uniref:hypothetical protein n=1 Tax=Escherichia coli TaxID=562 RepID=UPI002AFF9807
MLPSETMIWQPEFTDKTLSRKPGAVHSHHWLAIIQKYLKKKWCILSASAGRKYFIDVSVLNG